MSGSVIPLKAVLVRDPRLELDNQRVYGVLRGGANYSYQQFQANSVSNSSIQITCNPPSRRHVINRRLYLQVTFSLTFTGASGTAPILQNGFDGPRAYPLSSIITSQTISFANSTVSLGNFNEWWPYLLRYHNDVKSQELNYSGTPSMQDFFQAYGDWQNVGNTTTFGYGGAQRNPLAAAGDNSTQMTRAGFSGLNVTANPTSTGSNSATATLTVTEPVFMSPLVFARGDSESGFTGIEQMTATFTLGNLSNVWSHGIANSGAQPFNTPTVSVTNAALLFEYIEPDVTQTIPSAIVYPFFTVQPSITNSNTAFAYTDMHQLTNLSLQLNGVPRRMYVFARKSLSTSTYLDSDVAFRLMQLTVQFDSNTYLSNATEHDLYQISRKNGVNTSFSAWQKYSGSVFCAEFGTDIGMSPVFAPGTIGTHQLQISGLFQDINQNDTGGTTTTPTLYVIIIYEGTIASVDGSVIQQPNVLTNQDALNAVQVPGALYKHSESIYGGDFFGSLKNIFSKVGNVAGRIAKGVESVLPLASFVPGLSAAVPIARGVTGAVRAITGQGSYGGTRHRMRHALGMRPRMHMSGVSRRLHGRGFEDEEDGDDQDFGGKEEMYQTREDHDHSVIDEGDYSGGEESQGTQESQEAREQENDEDPIESYVANSRH